MEKIHGTSAWITFDKQNNSILFHSGGANSDKFKALFDADNLFNILSQKGHDLIKIHGEAYGGKLQKMGETYGMQLKFVTFDVYIENDTTKGFLNVDEAEKICLELGLEFVDYIKANNCAETVDSESLRESVQAIRNGMGPGKQREGVVVKPIIESYLSSGKRAIFKHKNKIFWEMTTARPLGRELILMSDIKEIVNEWLTCNRFEHVVDRILQTKEDKNITINDITRFMDLMVEDMKRESEGEVVWSKKLENQIRKETGIMFKQIYYSK